MPPFMQSAERQDTALQDRSGAFATTHWSVVRAAGADSSSSARPALEQLCRTYWFPLYAYVRRQGQSEPDAQDATQAFFAQFLEKGHVRLADPGRGRFRSFLLTCLKHFLVNEWERGQAARRGGGLRLISWEDEEAETRYQAGEYDGLSPDKVFDRHWAAAVLERALSRLRAEYAAGGRQELFEKLKTLVWGGTASGSYPEIAAALGMSEGAARVAVHRVRQRYRDLLRAEVAQTVSTPAEVDEELRYLIEILRQ